MKLVGLTGGIGCGKTTVVNAFRRIGIPCFVADEEAANYYNRPDFKEQIKVLFGDTVFLADDSIDKKAIAMIVFSDKNKLNSLNALIHPMVMNDFSQWAKRQTTQYVILESAILYEYSLDRNLDCMIAVYLEKEERLRRLELRDHVDRKALEARMANQLPAEEKMMRADYVILNYEGNPRQRQVELIDRWITNSEAFGL